MRERIEKALDKVRPMLMADGGIKGTTLVLGEQNGVSSLKVIEGVVEFTSKETGEKVDVKAGEQVSADLNGLSKVEPFDVQKESASWKTLDEIKSIKRTAVLLQWSMFAGAVVVILLVGFFVFKKKRAGVVVQGADETSMH